MTGPQDEPRRYAPEGTDEAAFEQAMLTRWPRLSPSGVAIRFGITALVFYNTWHAIQYRGATAMSLLLPMAAEVPVAVAAGFLLAIFVVRDEDFRRQVWSSVRPWSMIVAGFLIWEAYQGQLNGRAFTVQLGLVWDQAAAFMIGSGLVWAMLAAALGFGGGVINDIIAYKRNGPPFVYLGSLNFGLRTLLMLVFGFWLTCIVFAFDFTRRQSAEGMWVALLLAELLALWLPHIVQDRIRAARRGTASRNQNKLASADG